MISTLEKNIQGKGWKMGAEGHVLVNPVSRDGLTGWQCEQRLGMSLPCRGQSRWGGPEARSCLKYNRKGKKASVIGVE